MSLSVSEARLLTLFFTDILLGIHLVTFVISLWTQLVKRPTRGWKVNWLLVAVTLLMGTIGILDAGIDLALNIRVWTSGDVSLFTDLSYWMNVIEVPSHMVALDRSLRHMMYQGYRSSFTATIGRRRAGEFAEAAAGVTS